MQDSKRVDANANKQFRNVLPSFLPSKLVGVMYGLCGIEPEKRIHDITKEERERFLSCMKELELTVTGLRGYNEAIITKEVSQSKRSIQVLWSVKIFQDFILSEKCWIWMQ